MEETTDTVEPTVLVRVATVDLEEEPGWQRKTAWQLAPRSEAVKAAVGDRVEDDTARRIHTLLDEHVHTPVDFVLTRDYGEYGSIEITVLEATDPLPRRFLAVRHLAGPEAEVYLDAIVDDALAERDVTRVEIAADGLPASPQLALV